jgi:hypothetical protein
MSAPNLMALVKSLADVEAMPVTRLATDALQISVKASYGDEQIVVLHPELIVDGYPLIEFSVTFSTLSSRDVVPIRALASNLAEKNFDIRDAGWGFSMTPSGEYAVTISTRMHGGQLNHVRFLKIVQTLTDECAAARKQFLAKTGAIVAYPIDVIHAQSSEQGDDDEQDGSDMSHWLAYIRRVALLNGWQATYDEDDDLCITVGSQGREVTVYVAAAGQRLPREALVRFSSPGEYPVYGRDEIEDVAHQLMFRNASTLHAHWAVPWQDGAGIPVVVKNVLANELDAFRIRDIIKSFVIEYHYAIAKLGWT